MTRKSTKKAQSTEAAEPVQTHETDEKPAPSKDDNPLASGEVSLSALRAGARDNDSVRRLQYALDKSYPGSVKPTGNYQTRTAALVAKALDGGDGTTLTKDEAKKVMGSRYTFTD